MYKMYQHEFYILFSCWLTIQYVCLPHTFDLCELWDSRIIWFSKTVAMCTKTSQRNPIIHVPQAARLWCNYDLTSETCTAVYKRALRLIVWQGNLCYFYFSQHRECTWFHLNHDNIVLYMHLMYENCFDVCVCVCLCVLRCRKKQLAAEICRQPFLR